MVDLVILRAVCKCGLEPCLLGLFRMTFTVTMLRYILQTQSAFPESQAILQAAASMQDSNNYNDTA